MKSEANDASLDLFALGRDALAAARAAFAGRAFFVSARHAQADGSWLGPSEATLALVEENALAGLGGLVGARKLGANAVLCNLEGVSVREALSLGMRCLVRVPYTAGESADLRRARLGQLAELIVRLPGIDGVLPTPVGEAQGLDTLQFFAACRVACLALHVVVDL